MPLSKFFSAISNYGTPSTGIQQPTVNYALPAVQASPVPLLDDISLAEGLNMNAWMPAANYGGGLGNFGSFMQNYGGTLLGAAQGLGNLFLGMKQYGLAKDALKESRRQFQLNYDAQRKLTNARLMDRQNARRAADPTRHMSAEEYLEKYGV